jgi:hypothetical protein
MAGIEPHASRSLVKQGYAALTARPAVSSGVDRRPRMLIQRTGSDPCAGDSAGYGPSGGSEGQGRPSSCSTGTVYVGTRDAGPGHRHASHGIRVLGIGRADGRLLSILILVRRSGFPGRAARQTGGRQPGPAARTAAHRSQESHWQGRWNHTTPGSPLGVWRSTRPAREMGPGPPGLAVLRVRSGPPDRARMR